MLLHSKTYNIFLYFSFTGLYEILFFAGQDVVLVLLWGTVHTMHFSGNGMNKKQQLWYLFLGLFFFTVLTMQDKNYAHFIVQVAMDVAIFILYSFIFFHHNTPFVREKKIFKS